MVQKRYPVGTVLLLVGTQGGLFLVSSADRVRWEVQATALQSSGSRVFYAWCDTRRSPYRLFATDNHDQNGARLLYSDDVGDSWHEARLLSPSKKFKDVEPKNFWFIEPGRSNERDVLYLGADPASLWVSSDGGLTWEVDEALLAHPLRSEWIMSTDWACVHSIVVDAYDPARMWLGLSGAGCLRTLDGRQSWHVINRQANDSELFVDTASHRLLQDLYQPDVLYQQNRSGVYRSSDGGQLWHNISSNLPSSFGFPLALSPSRPDALWTVVADPETRFSLSHRFAVYRTQNAGLDWQAFTDGLPEKHFKVLRHALCTDTLTPCGVYVGSTDGHLFASTSDGERWQCISSSLSPIYSVSTAIISL